MRKALIVSENEQTLDVTIRHILSYEIEDLCLFGAKTKDRAIEQISYGDIGFMVLDDDMDFGSSIRIINSAKKIGSKLLVLTHSQNKTRAFERYKHFDLVKCLEKPDYFFDLEVAIARIYPFLR